MAKSNPFTPTLNPTAVALAETLGIPQEHASKALGSSLVARLKSCLERGFDPSAVDVTDYTAYKVACRRQDKAIARAAAKADAKADMAFAVELELLELEYNAQLTADERMLTGRKSADDIRQAEQAKTEQQSKADSVSVQVSQVGPETKVGSKAKGNGKGKVSSKTVIAAS